MRLEFHILHHRDDRGVDLADQELRVNTNDEHQRERGQHDQALLPTQVRQPRPLAVERSAEYALQHGQQKNRRDQQAQHRQSRGPGGQRKRTFKNQEFTDKPVQTRQSERRKNRNAHQAAKYRRRFSQPAKIVHTPQPAAALLQKRDETEEDWRGQPVIEHLQQDTVQDR